MKKKFKNRLRMLRPSDGFLPLAFIIASALGKSTESEQVFLNALFPALFALASARGLRIAVSEQPSMRRVAGSVKLALSLQFIGALAFLVAGLIRNYGRFALSGAICICAGMLLNIEHVFYEYLFAAGEARSAAFLRAITAALTGAGIMMTSSNAGEGLLPYSLEWLLGGTALSALIAAVIGRGVGGRLKGRVNNRILKCAPLSIAQSAIYPVAWLLALMLLKPIMYTGITAVPFFAGLLVYDLSRAPFRREAGYSKGFNIAMLAVALIGAILTSTYFVPQAQTYLKGIIGNWSSELPPLGVMLIASSVCGFGLYGRIGKE